MSVSSDHLTTVTMPVTKLWSQVYECWIHFIQCSQDFPLVTQQISCIKKWSLVHAFSRLRVYTIIYITGNPLSPATRLIVSSQLYVV